MIFIKIVRNILNLLDDINQKKIIDLISLKLKEKAVIFDVGAHHGETIKKFNKKLSIKKIYSFEASPLSYNILRNTLPNIISNQKGTDICIENLAIGSEIKKIQMKHLKESSSSTIKDINSNSKYFKKKKFLFGFNAKNFYQNITVDQTTIDKYVKSRKIEQIDFLKIDTEGYEYEILKGASENLKNIKIILFEHHYDDMIEKGYKFSDINNILLKNNFKQIFKIKMPFRKTFEYIYLNMSY